MDTTTFVFGQLSDAWLRETFNEWSDDNAPSAEWAQLYAVGRKAIIEELHGRALAYVARDVQVTTWGDGASQERFVGTVEEFALAFGISRRLAMRPSGSVEGETHSGPGSLAWSTISVKTKLEHGERCGVRSPWHSGCVRFADECDGVTHWDIPGQPEQVWMTPSAAERVELERHRFSFEGATALLAAHLLDDHGANLLAVAPWRNGLSQGDWVALDSLHLQAHLRGA